MRNFLYKILLSCIVLMVSTTITGFSDNNGTYKYDHRMDANYVPAVLPELSLLYDNVWATVYHPEKSQCDETPYLTGDGSKIDKKNTNKLRWVAISQEMLHSVNRQKLLTYSRTNLFKGKICYGDTIWVSSEYPEINGWWVVHDTKNAKIHNSIDFLQSKSKKSLYGKWEDVKIYKLKNISYKEYGRRMSL
jgi:hypothetical protein